MADATRLSALLDRPGRSINVPLAQYAPPRVLSHIIGAADGEPPRSSSQMRVSLRIHLSQRVLLYLRHKIWGSSRLADRASPYAREPVDVRVAEGPGRGRWGARGARRGRGGGQGAAEAAAAAGAAAMGRVSATAPPAAGRR